MAPPEDLLGGVVPLGLLVARSAKAAVSIASATAYPTGLEFTVDVRWRGRTADPAWHPAAWRRDPNRGDELPDELFRVGVELADGSKATTLDALPGSTVAHTVAASSWPPEPPGGPVLMPRGGGGGIHSWSQGFWLWPLPPEGPLSFVCEWPVHDIPLSRAAVDAAVIRAAAERARPLWD
jgi:hypothetical protein